MKQNKLGCFEQLWKPIIRPPRHTYNVKDLGNEVCMFGHTVTKRNDFQIVNKRQLTLECSLFEPVRIQDKSHPCVIYLHGNSSSRVEALTIIEYLIPMNISVCGIDLSGSGHSEGTYISLGWYESRDVESLYEYLREHKPFITNVALWGRSMGSVTAIISASSNDIFKVLVCDSPFSDLTRLCQDLASTSYHIPGCCFSCFWCFIKSKIRNEAKFSIDDLNIAQIIQTLSEDVSIMFLSAKQDTLINEKHPKMLLEKFRGQKQLLSFEGNHNSKRPQNIMHEAVKFLISKFGKDSWEPMQSSREHKQIFMNQSKRDKFSFQIDEAQPIISDHALSQFDKRPN